MSTSKRVKSVEWSYPSSDNAKRFGFDRTGCWTVQVGNYGEPLEAITGHASREAALNHAHSLAIRWTDCFVRFHPEDAERFPPFVFERIS